MVYTLAIQWCLLHGIFTHIQALGWPQTKLVFGPSFRRFSCWIYPHSNHEMDVAIVCLWGLFLSVGGKWGLYRESVIPPTHQSIWPTVNQAANKIFETVILLSSSTLPSRFNIANRAKMFLPFWNGLCTSPSDEMKLQIEAESRIHSNAALCCALGHNTALRFRTCKCF